MLVHWELAALMVTLTLNYQGHAGEIMGGHEAVPHSRPYMALLELEESSGKELCGGFLLNEEFVMTAAHCQAKGYKVLLGVHDIYKENEIQKISVAKRFPNKDYNPDKFINDIMLLQLSRKANFNNHVRPIVLADQGDGSLPTSCSVSGWGRYDKNTTYQSTTLREANVTLVDKTLCAENKMYCSEGETGPAPGDSGGPLVCDGKAYGVVSGSFTPASGGPPLLVYTMIPENREWINFIMKSYSYNV